MHMKTQKLQKKLLKPTALFSTREQLFIHSPYCRVNQGCQTGKTVCYARQTKTTQQTNNSDLHQLTNGPKKQQNRHADAEKLPLNPQKTGPRKTPTAHHSGPNSGGLRNRRDFHYCTEPRLRNHPPWTPRNTSKTNPDDPISAVTAHNKISPHLSHHTTNKRKRRNRCAHTNRNRTRQVGRN